MMNKLKSNLKKLKNLLLYYLLKRLLPEKIRKFMREKLLGTGFELILDISTCNLACSMCARGGINSLENPDTGMMSFVLFKRIIDKFTNENIKITYLEFGNWGEPLLNPDLPKMISYIKSKPDFMTRDCAVNVNTNLTFLPDPVAFIKSGVNRIHISISGMSQEVYSRNHRGGNVKSVLNNILKLVNAKNTEKLGNIIIILVSHDYICNKKDAELAKKFCDQHGLIFCLKRIYICTVEDNIKFQQEKEKLAKFYNHFIELDKEINLMKTIDPLNIKDCKLLKNRVTLNFNGQLYRCCGVFEKKYFMGSVFDFKIKDIPNIKSEICEKCAKTPISWR